MTEPVRRAQAAGQVSAEQAVVIASAVNQLDPSMPVVEVEQAQHDLIGFAGVLLFAGLARVANRVVEVVDPDGADQLLEQQLRRQERAGLAGCELGPLDECAGQDHVVVGVGGTTARGARSR